jgi:hypothetical protein
VPSALKVEAVCSSETLISTYKSTWCHHLEYHDGHLHLRSLIQYVIFHVITSAGMNMGCFAVESDINFPTFQRYCLHHQGDRPDDGGISETSVNVYQTTRRNIPQDSHLLIQYIRSCPPYLEAVSDLITQPEGASYHGDKESLNMGCYDLNCQITQ